LSIALHTVATGSGVRWHTLHLALPMAPAGSWRSRVFAMNRRSEGRMVVVNSPTTEAVPLRCDGCGHEYPARTSGISLAIFFPDREWIDFCSIYCFDECMFARRGRLHDGRVLTLSRESFTYGLCLPFRT
jgi:hypothetical protein